jgi:hypothetical protein
MTLGAETIWAVVMKCHIANPADARRTRKNRSIGFQGAKAGRWRPNYINLAGSGRHMAAVDAVDGSSTGT